MQNEEVELHPAFRWDCPGCGAKSYVDSVPAELTDDERKALLAMMGTEPSDEDAEFIQTGELVTAPTAVTCPKCQEEYPVEPPGTPMEDGFDPHKDLGT